MKKPLKKIKIWLVLHGRRVGIVLSVVIVLAVGLWHSSTIKPIKAQEDFGDRETSELAKEISGIQFEEAVELWQQGKLVKARSAMQRLAPLSIVDKKPVGNSLAHMWLAKELLADYGFGYLKAFPYVEDRGKVQIAAKIVADPLIADKAMKHFYAASVIGPITYDIVEYRLEALLGSGKRVDAINFLIDVLGKQSDLNYFSESLLLGHILYFDGEEKEVEEVLWHKFTVLGRELELKGRSEYGLRFQCFYLALALGEFDVAQRYAAALQNDLGADVGYSSAVKALAPSIEYFKALSMYFDDSVGLDEVFSYIKTSYESSEGNPLLVEVLSEFIERYPEFSVQFGKEINVNLNSARAYALSMKVAPERGQSLIAGSIEVADGDPEGFLDFVDYGISEGLSFPESHLVKIEEFANDLAQPLLVRIRACRVAGKLLSASGEPRRAIVYFERVINEDRYKSSDDHAALEKLYAEVGEQELADAHHAIALKFKVERNL